MFVKAAQHKADAPVVRAGVQLAVGKGPRAALAELDVVFPVQRAAGAKALDRREARVDIAAALEHDGLCPRAGKQQRGEHPRRAEAHDDRTLPRRLNLRDRILFFRIRREIRAFFSRQQTRFFLFLKRDGERADIMDVILSPRVERAAHKPRLQQLLLPHAQPFRRAHAKKRERLALFEAQIAYEDHVSSLPAATPLDQAHCRL